MLITFVVIRISNWDWPLPTTSPLYRYTCESSADLSSPITRRQLAAHRSAVADFYDKVCKNYLNGDQSGSDMRLLARE